MLDLFLYPLLFVMFVTITTRRMLSIAKSIHNGLPRGALPLWLNVKQAPSISSHSDPAHLWKAAEKKLTHLLSDAGQPRRYFARITSFWFYFLTSSPSYKRNWQPDPDKMVLEDTSLPSFQILGFLNKVAISPLLIYWPVPWTEEPGGLQSMGSRRVGHD